MRKSSSLVEIVGECGKRANETTDKHRYSQMKEKKESAKERAE
jgi:hypothetical protein